MGDTLVQVKELNKTYRMGSINVHALRSVTLTIDRGDMVAIMGPSGSGKSTFMNLIGCLDQPTSGSYLLDGIEVADLNDNQLAAVRCKKIGFVFQTFNLLARTSALQNVELPLFYSRVRDREKIAKNCLSQVGLGDRMEHLPNQLSGGQQQRVAIARALVNDPAVLLADEPTGALDSRTGEEIMAVFQDLHRQGKTVVVVTHEPDIAEHASRVIRFQDGLLVSDKRNTSPLDARRVLETMPRIDDLEPVAA